MNWEWITNNGSTIVGGAFGLGGVYLGHWLTIRLQNKKRDALEQGMYGEVQIIASDLTDWLHSLIDEMNHPIRDSYSGMLKFDTGLLMALVVELVAVDKIITVEQRKFIMRMQKKLDGICADDVSRTKETERRMRENPPDAPFNIPTNITARLLFNVVETIFFLKKFLADKRSFTTQQTADFPEMAEIACNEANLDFKPTFWEHVYRIYAPKP